MFKTRFLKISIVLFILFAMGFFAATASAKPIELSYYWILGKSSLQWKGSAKFMDAVEKATNGEIKFKRYCCRTLGKENAVMEQARSGSLDIHLTGVGVWGKYAPKLNMLIAPYVFNDYEHAYRFVVSKHWDSVTADLKKANIYPLMALNAGFRSILTREKPVRKVADLQGMKIKISPTKPWAILWKELGSIATPIPPSEQYIALKTGVVDGLEMQPTNAISIKLYEVVKYFSGVKAAWTGPVAGMNLDRWNSLSKRHQEIMLDAAREASKWTFDMGKKENEEALRTMVEKHGLVEVKDVDVEDFRKAVREKVYPAFEGKNWYDPELLKLMQQVK
jgi:tripartite ATP-independent transporter DctP family solute receptor